MNRISAAVLTALATVAATVLTGAAVLYSGVLDVAADTPHSPMVHSLLETARERAIARRAGDITPPSDLDDAERQRRGAGNYAAMCANCHLLPGVENSEIRLGLYPTPPDLVRAEAVDARGVARQFWIIKHGIKASGMPAWSKGGMEDAAIWDLVAFLGRLPALSPDQYRALVAASDGHAHAGAPQATPSPSGQGDDHPHDHGDHAH